jgi:hypothetical protein
MDGEQSFAEKMLHKHQNMLEEGLLGACAGGNQKIFDFFRDKQNMFVRRKMHFVVKTSIACGNADFIEDVLNTSSRYSFRLKTVDFLTKSEEMKIAVDDIALSTAFATALRRIKNIQFDWHYDVYLKFAYENAIRGRYHIMQQLTIDLSDLVNVLCQNWHDANEAVFLNFVQSFRPNQLIEIFLRVKHYSHPITSKSLSGLMQKYIEDHTK